MADERDVVGLRTNHRGEQVYLYRLKSTPALARALLLDYVDSINGLVEQPQFYNALVDNCTTSIRRHRMHVDPDAPPFDWRLVVNGYLDRLLYERSIVDTRLPFEELRSVSPSTARRRRRIGIPSSPSGYAKDCPIRGAFIPTSTLRAPENSAECEGRTAPLLLRDQLLPPRTQRLGFVWPLHIAARYEWPPSPRTLPRLLASPLHFTRSLHLPSPLYLLPRGRSGRRRRSSGRSGAAGPASG